MARSFEREKFRRMVQFFASRGRDDERLGLTKLNKLLYYADTIAYRELGEPISGITYEHWQEGPVPEKMNLLREEMRGNGTIRIVETTYHGHAQKRVTTYHVPNMSIFRPEELVILERVSAQFADSDASEMSRLSHLEPGWRVTGQREPIPYDYSWLAPTRLTDEKIAHARRLAARHGHAG